MKKFLIRSLFSVVLFSWFSNIKAQTLPFTKYFCEIDTQFNGQRKLANKKLMSSSVWGSNVGQKLNSSPSGLITGAAFYRSSSFKYFSDKSNVKTFTSAHIYTCHNSDSSGLKSSHIGKSEVVFNIGGDLSLSKFSYIPFSPSVSPIPVQLNKIELGVSTYQSPDDRGNFFASEKFYKDNISLFSDTKDTFGRSNSRVVITSPYPSDNTDYSAILDKLNSNECTGWLIEVDRNNNSFQNRRFDLGRSMRKSYIINSVRTQASGSASLINRTFQILGGELNVLIKTELNNNIQEFSVYSEVLNKYGSHWTLLNKLEGGSIQPLSKEVLLDVFKYIVVNPDLEFTYFLNITDIKINDITNSIVLVSPGGEFVLETLKNEYNTTHNINLASSLTSQVSGGKIVDKLGQIMEIDGYDEFTFFKLGITTKTGKFVSNVESITFYNLPFINNANDPINTSYAILSEKVFDNTLGQNPPFKKNINDFQNEVYLVDLAGLSGIVVGFKDKQFELFQVLPSNTHTININYSETYMPYFSVVQNKTLGIDSLCMIRGFADFFVAPENCNENSSIDDLYSVDETFHGGIYPNPLECQSGECVLKLQRADDVQIYSFSGQLVVEYSRDEKIRLDGLKPGLYVVRGLKGWSEKLIIQ